MSKYKIHELDGKTMSVKELLDHWEELPKFTPVNKDGVYEMSKEELKRDYLQRTGHFFMYKEEDGVMGGEQLYQVRLFWFLDKEKGDEDRTE